MGKKKNRRQTIKTLTNIIGTVGMPFVSEALKDREVLEDWITEYLNEELAKTDPLEFEIAFENNADLSENLDNNTLKGVKEFIDENSLDMREIHNNVRYHLPSFNSRWAMDWLRRDLPEFYERILLHPDRVEFEAWLSRQIRSIGEIILNLFRSY